MAEGPVVHHYAKRLRAVLQDKEVRIEFGLKKLKASEPSVSKIRILKVECLEFFAESCGILFQTGHAFQV